MKINMLVKGYIIFYMFFITGGVSVSVNIYAEPNEVNIYNQLETATINIDVISTSDIYEAFIDVEIPPGLEVITDEINRGGFLDSVNTRNGNNDNAYWWSTRNTCGETASLKIPVMCNVGEWEVILRDVRLIDCNNEQVNNDNINFINGNSTKILGNRGRPVITLDVQEESGGTYRCTIIVVRKSSDIEYCKLSSDEDDYLNSWDPTDIDGDEFRYNAILTPGYQGYNEITAEVTDENGLVGSDSVRRSIEIPPLDVQFTVNQQKIYIPDNITFTVSIEDTTRKCSFVDCVISMNELTNRIYNETHQLDNGVTRFTHSVSSNNFEPNDYDFALEVSDPYYDRSRTREINNINICEVPPCYPPFEPNITVEPTKKDFKFNEGEDFELHIYCKNDNCEDFENVSISILHDELINIDNDINISDGLGDHIIRLIPKNISSHCTEHWTLNGHIRDVEKNESVILDQEVEMTWYYNGEQLRYSCPGGTIKLDIIDINLIDRFINILNKIYNIVSTMSYLAGLGSGIIIKSYCKRCITKITKNLPKIK